MKAADSIEDLLESAKAIGYGEIPAFTEAKSYTIGAFDLIVAHARDKQNVFALLQSLCTEYPRIRDDRKWMQGYVFLLSQFALASDTTELPEGMEEILSEHPELTEDLRKWYRK
jgi:hypothetical protein